MNTNTSELAAAEDMLAAAGIATTQVDACDDAHCSWCRPDPVPLAA